MYSEFILCCPADLNAVLSLSKIAVSRATAFMLVFPSLQILNGFSVHVVLYVFLQTI
jgi:hypothetical protein